MTTPQYPPAWQPPTEPAQPEYPSPPHPGGSAPRGYPPQRSDGATGGYPPRSGAPGGHPPAAYPPNPGYPPQGQPYPGQSPPGQSYAGHAQAGQSYPAQSYAGQPHPGQQHPGQQHPGQPYGQPQPSQPYGQSQPSQPYGQSQPGQPYGQPFPGQSYPAQSYPGQSYPAQSYPNQSYAGQPHPGQPYPAQPYQAEPQPNQPYGRPHPGQPYGSQSYPPAGAQRPGYQSDAPTAVLGRPLSHPSAEPDPFARAEPDRPYARPEPDRPPYPPAEPDRPAGRPAPRKKKSVGKTIAGVLASVVTIGCAVALKIGAGTLLSTVTDPPAPSNPFEGTLAESYPSGEAGIQVPPATEVPGFTEAEVAAALDTVRQALVAGRLDEQMLYNHDRSKLRALFSPLGAEELDRLFDEKLGGIVATMIAPDYRLTDDPIRVSGTMTFTGTVMEDIRWLEVHTTFVWVYPFEGELKTPGDHLVTIKDDLYWLFPAPEDVVPDAVGMYLDGRSSSFAHNIDCELLEQDLVALGKPRFGFGEEIDPDAVMDPNSTVNLPDTC
jgi:hypothetical protein